MTAFWTTPNLRYSLHLQGNLHANGLLRLAGGTGDVRGQDDVVQREVRRILQWLLAEDVEGGAGHLAERRASTRAARRSARRGRS